jgi:putative DNA primase/helicase
MRASRAAKLAETVWRAAQAASADHPYLTRKGVAPVDTLREMDAEKLAALIGYQPKRGDDLLAGRILIAPVKISGKLSTLEMIDGDGRKSALTGGVKTGGYWATQKLTVSPKLVLIAEGVATALSASQCTGYPAIASLSVGQMEVAAKAIREHHPEASLVLLADLDKATGEPHLTAVKAAQSLDVCLAAPDFGGVRPEGATDFNDLHVARGAEVVKACIEAARIPDTGDRAPMAGIAKPPQCAAALRLAEDAIARTLAGDAGALFDIVNTLRDLRKDYPGDYARLRARIRKECREVSIGELEKQMRSDVDISDEKSMADLLIELADDRCELFHDPDNTGYALLDGAGTVNAGRCTVRASANG